MCHTIVVQHTKPLRKGKPRGPGYIWTGMMPHGLKLIETIHDDSRISWLSQDLEALDRWDPSNYGGLWVISTLGTMCCSIRNARLLNFPNESRSLRKCCLKTKLQLPSHHSTVSAAFCWLLLYIRSTQMCVFMRIYCINFIFLAKLHNFSMRYFLLNHLYPVCCGLFGFITAATNHSCK